MEDYDKPAQCFFPQGNSHPAQKPDSAESRVFIQAQLDDYGLKATVFRVYCHMARRDGWPCASRV
jgi:hypothetical protein